MRITQRNYIQAELKECQHNIRKSWQLIKEIINKNRTKTQKLPKITINKSSLPRVSNDPMLSSFTSFPQLDSLRAKHSLCLS